jgi:hypothetical protein
MLTSGIVKIWEAFHISSNIAKSFMGNEDVQRSSNSGDGKVVALNIFSYVSREMMF